MKSFICKMTVMVLAVAGTSAVLWFMPGNYINKLAMMINKRDTLIASAPPRIILIGGSNLLGVKSGVLHKEFGLNVVNFGCWGGFRVEDIYDEIESHCTAGDTVIIVQEYYAMCPVCPSDDETGELFKLLFNPTRTVAHYFRDGKPQEIISVFVKLMQLKVKGYIRQLANMNVENIFTGGYFFYNGLCNEYGDRKVPFLNIRPLRFAGFTYHKFDFSHLDEIHRRCRDKGIRVAFSFSPFPEKEYELNKGIITRLHRLMTARCPVPLLNEPRDNVYPESYFSDSAYHMTDEGEEVRTARLVRQLKRFFAERR